MHQARMSHRVVRFSLFEVDLDAAELRKNGLKLKIQEQPFHILSLLLDRPGEIVTREELQQKLWPDGTFVDFEHGVNTAVKKLREALGDDAESPRFIETVPRRGYRFIAPLDGHKPAAVAAAGVNTPRISRGRIVFFSCLLLAGLAALVWRTVVASQTAPRMRNMVQLTFTGQTAGCCSEVPQSIQTDGKRIYFSDSSFRLRYVSVAGGEEVRIRTDLQPQVILLHLSPDASTLLVRESVGSEGTSESPLWLVPANGGAPRRLGDVEAQDGAWSPDGKTIAFARGDSIFVTDNLGHNPRRILTVAGRPFWIRWSPKGEKLRFTVRDAKFAFSAKLWETDMQGVSRQLLTDWTGAQMLCCGVWGSGGEYFFLGALDGSPQIWALPKELRLLPNARPISVSIPGTGSFESITDSPMEKKLFVLGHRSISEVYAVNVATRQSTQLLPDLVPSRMSYSLDGKWATFVQYHDDKSELWRSRPDGTRLLQLTEPPLRPMMPLFSSDGSRIVFVGKLPNQLFKVYWVASEGGGLHELPTDVANQIDPTWLPDGQSIVFGEPPHTFAESGKQKAIYVSNLKTQLTSKLPGSDGWFSPRVSPDGRYVAAMSIDIKRLGLFDFRDGKWRTLDEPGGLDNPFWSRDSQWIYFNDTEGGIWRIRARDGHKELLPSLGSQFSNSNCYPHGFTPTGSLVFSCSSRSADIYAITWE